MWLMCMTPVCACVDVFRMLDRVCPPHAILATNTSSLDVDAIANVTQRPTQVAPPPFAQVFYGRTSFPLHLPLLLTPV